jgi:PKD repeat protein
VKFLGVKNRNVLKRAVAFFLVVLFWQTHSFSQSVTPILVGSEGAFDSGGGITVSYTIGEIATETFTGNGGATIVTQGFQQPENICTPGMVNAGNITSNRDSVCQDTKVKLDDAGSAGTIQWQSATSPGNFSNVTGADSASLSIPLSQTTYFRVYAINKTCSDTSTVDTIIVPSPVQSSFTSVLSGLTVEFTNTTTGAVTYVWDFGDSTQNSSEFNPSHTFSKAGTFYVCLTAYNGTNCSSTLCQYITVGNPNGVASVSGDNSWKVYPDPAGDYLFIKNMQATEKMESLEVYDVLGRLLLSKSMSGVNDNPVQLNVSFLPASMYYLKIKTADANYIQSIIKQ